MRGGPSPECPVPCCQAEGVCEHSSELTPAFISCTEGVAGPSSCLGQRGVMLAHRPPQVPAPAPGWGRRCEGEGRGAGLPLTGCAQSIFVRQPSAASMRNPSGGVLRRSKMLGPEQNKAAAAPSPQPAALPGCRAGRPPGYDV